MRVLVVGSGAREHALAWRLEQDGAEVTVAPGNGGTARRSAVAAGDVAGLADLAARERFELTIVGPEEPLSKGIVDTFAARGLKVFGPTQRAAQLEWSKGWAKEFLLRHAIPTARAETVEGVAAARSAIQRLGLPVALKADGLAAGKGVFIVHSAAEAEEALARCADFGQRMLVEELLEGPELSVLAFCDGERFAVMPPCRDYKRLADGDRGPNTGGMGGYSRPADATPQLVHWVADHVLRATVEGMAREGTPYRGVLYAGLMLTGDGPKVLEFNCRFGDPECQLVLPLLDSSLLEVCQAVAEGERLAMPQWRDGPTYGVVLAADGYPEAPRRGDTIASLGDVGPEVHMFHGGTEWRGAELCTNGGRVLTLVSQDRAAVYQAAEHVQFAGKHFRRDIGLEQPAMAVTR